MRHPFIVKRTSRLQRLVGKTSDDRDNHRAYAGHEPSEAHTTADPIDLGAPSALIGPR